MKIPKNYRLPLIIGWTSMLVGFTIKTPSNEWKEECNEYYQENYKVVQIENNQETKDIWQQAEEKYNIEWELLKAIWKHETGNGTSKAWLQYNNPGGLMYWNKSKGKMDFYKFKTQNDGIMKMAEILRKYYLDQGLTTIEQIGAKYCPVGTNDNGYNKYWIPKVTQYYEEYKKSY